MVELPKRELKPVSKNNLLNKIMYKTNKKCTETTKKKVNEIILSLLIKDWDSLKKYSLEGLPEEMPLLRSLLWKMNLKYLNTDLENWDEYLNKKRSHYFEIKQAFLEKLLMEKKIFMEIEKEELQEGYKSSLLSDIDSDIKKTAFEDRRLLEDIDKDIRRTHTYMNFFYLPSKLSENISEEEIKLAIDKRKSNDSNKNIEELYRNRQNTWESNSEVMVRILFIYAKLNPEVSYVQGMNEILAPIYFCLFSEEENCQNISLMDELDIKKNIDYKYEPDVEADSFWTFSSLMLDIKELFIQDKDNKQGGIFAKLSILSEILKVCDKDVFNHLKNIKLDLQLISFKWVVLLFTQDFILPDILRVWDALLSEEDKFYMVYLICISILTIKRKDILKSDFAGVISKLQKINSVDIEKIISTALEIKVKFDKKIKKIIYK